jgi:hypothetical protein
VKLVDQLRGRLHDTTLPTLVRAGGALVLLYGLPVSRVTALRHDDIHTDTKRRTWLQFGGHRLRLPPAVATLLLAQQKHAVGASAIARAHPGDTAWLFPGGPARDALYRALRTHLHIHLRRARSAALAALAADLPAAVLADLLDININTAITWSTYAQTDWTAYLAARTRRSS